MEDIGTAVERYFVPVFEAQQKFPMDEDTSRMLITLLFSKTGGDLPADMMKDLREKSLAIKIMESRITALGYEADDTFLVFMSTMIDTPGTAVMYAHYMAYRAGKAGLKRITLKFLCESCFPFGFPNDDGLQKAWDAQKSYNKEEFKDMNIHAGNLLDHMPANKSLVFKNIK